MIRVIFRFLSSGSNTYLDSHTCEKVVEFVEGSIYEVWLRCSSSDVLRFIEDALNRGLVLVVVEFLNGLKRRGFQLDLGELVKFGQYDDNLEVNRIVVRYYRQPSEWLGMLPVKRCRINVEKKQALIELTKPIKISTLFDCGLKLLAKV
ncbi:MAG: hypothetical protein QW096_13725 [Thermofilaceae archaeon]